MKGPLILSYFHCYRKPTKQKNPTKQLFLSLLNNWQRLYYPPSTIFTLNPMHVKLQSCSYECFAPWTLTNILTTIQSALPQGTKKSPYLVPPSHFKVETPFPMRRLTFLNLNFKWKKFFLTFSKVVLSRVFGDSWRGAPKWQCRQWSEKREELKLGSDWLCQQVHRSHI